MVRRTAAVAMACALGMTATVACGSFDAAAPPATEASDAASESTTTTPPPPIEAGAERFCEKNPGAGFCDDFDQPNRDLSVDAPWTDTSSKGPQAFSLDEGKDSPKALRVQGPLGPTNETKLTKLYEVQGKKLRFEMDVKVDALARTTEAGDDLAHFGVAGILFDGGRELVIFLNALDTGEITAFVRNTLENAGSINRELTRKPAPPEVGGGWFRLAIEYEPKTPGPGELRFYLGPATSPALTIAGDPPPGSSALVIGTRGSAIDCNVDVSFDNVLVTTF